MEIILSLLIAILSGLIGFVGATLKIQKEDELLWGRERIQLIENLYSDLIACMSKMINSVIGDLSNKDSEFELICARIELHGSKEVIEALHQWHEIFNDWASNFRSGEPRKIGESGYSIYSSNQSKFSKRAFKILPELHEAGKNIIIKCRKHIELALNSKPNKFSLRVK